MKIPGCRPQNGRPLLRCCPSHEEGVRAERCFNERTPFEKANAIRSRQTRDEKTDTYTQANETEKAPQKIELCKMAAEQARHKKMYASPYNEAYIGRGDVLSASTMAASPSVSGALPVRLLNHMRCD